MILCLPESELTQAPDVYSCMEAASLVIDYPCFNCSMLLPDTPVLHIVSYATSWFLGHH